MIFQNINSGLAFKACTVIMVTNVQISRLRYFFTSTIATFEGWGGPCKSKNTILIIKKMIKNDGITRKHTIWTWHQVKNDQKHTMKIAEKWVKVNKVKVLEWPWNNCAAISAYEAKLWMWNIWNAQWTRAIPSVSLKLTKITKITFKEALSKSKTQSKHLNHRLLFEKLYRHTMNTEINIRPCLLRYRSTHARTDNCFPLVKGKQKHS